MNVRAIERAGSEEDDGERERGSKGEEEQEKKERRIGENRGEKLERWRDREEGGIA